jgi:uncharacterized protein (TIGR02996 family)
MPFPAFTEDDKAFVLTILSNPAELTAWLVYADWLDEHGHPRHAEFLRLMVRRGPLCEADPEWPEVEARLQELRAELPAAWVETFDRPPVENCAPGFRPTCPGRWENLAVTHESAVRRCDNCGKAVYYCHTLAEARERARGGECVAVSLGVRRTDGDLTRRSTASVAGQVLMGFIEAHNNRPEDPPRRPWWKFWSRD